MTRRHLTPAAVERILDAIDYQAIIAKHVEQSEFIRTNQPDPRCRPVKWMGQMFDSITALEMHAGISTQRIGYHLKTYGDLSRLEAKMGAV